VEIPDINSDDADAGGVDLFLDENDAASGRVSGLEGEFDLGGKKRRSREQEPCNPRGGEGA